MIRPVPPITSLAQLMEILDHPGRFFSSNYPDGGFIAEIGQGDGGTPWAVIQYMDSNVLEDEIIGAEKDGRLSYGPYCSSWSLPSRIKHNTDAIEQAERQGKDDFDVFGDGFVNFYDGVGAGNPHPPGSRARHKWAEGARAGRFGRIAAADGPDRAKLIALKVVALDNRGRHVLDMTSGGPWRGEIIDNERHATVVAVLDHDSLFRPGPDLAPPASGTPLPGRLEVTDRASPLLRYDGYRFTEIIALQIAVNAVSGQRHLVSDRTTAAGKPLPASAMHVRITDATVTGTLRRLADVLGQRHDRAVVVHVRHRAQKRAIELSHRFARARAHILVVTHHDTTTPRPSRGRPGR